MTAMVAVPLLPPREQTDAYAVTSWHPRCSGGSKRKEAGAVDAPASRFFSGNVRGYFLAGSSSDFTFVALTVPLACVKLNWFDFIFALNGVSIIMV